jgi:hypothetical protein
VTPGQINLNMLYEKVGEVGAIAREAKHAANNASAKIDSLAIVVATQGETRAHVDRLEKSVETLSEDVETLQADKLRREGAIGLVEWISKNYPFLALCIMLALWVGYANGVFK